MQETRSRSRDDEVLVPVWHEVSVQRLDRLHVDATPRCIQETPDCHDPVLGAACHESQWRPAAEYGGSVRRLEPGGTFFLAWVQDAKGLMNAEHGRYAGQGVDIEGHLAMLTGDFGPFVECRSGRTSQDQEPLLLIEAP